MRMDPGLDTGPVLSQRGLFISPDETAGTLSLRLANLGAELLIDTLPGYLEGTIQPQPQNTTIKSTYAPMLKKEEGHLDFSQPVQSLARRVRAFNPWPGTFIFWNGQLLKIHQAHVEAEVGGEYTPGERVILQDLPAISALDGQLILDEVQPAGKKSMPGKAFLQGARDWEVMS